jgi:hypothetical protein
VIGRTIHLNAPNGTVGQAGAGQEVDKGHPFSFSWLFDEATSTTADNTVEPFTAALDGTGEWIFGTSFHTPHDSDGWWFHVATVDTFHSLLSSTVHFGPFLIDTIAPIIVASHAAPNGNGWFNHDVQVDFTATDERSGFLPGGSLTSTLPSQTSAGEGSGLIITSGNITDRAGNQAVPAQVSLNVDKTAPVITAGTPQGTPGPGGTFTSDVTVPFTATDNLSGFAPGGSLTANLADKTVSGPGTGLTVTSDTIMDLAGNLASPVSAGPFSILFPGPTPTPPGGPFSGASNTNDLGALLNFYKVYYEILSPSQFLSFEPALKVGLYAYHPLTVTDNKTEGITLDVGAYEFIENNIKLKKEPGL